MLFLFSLTLFISALLLFLIQPIFGKLILPILGSTPNVWNTCMVFFQAVLLLGYIYAHGSVKVLGVKKQALIHSLLLFLPAFSLPIVLHYNSDPPVNNPLFWLIGVLFISVGLPFFITSVNGPMLQKWFSTINHKHSADPYFLYVASNWGSLLALLAYPFLIEPNLNLKEQTDLWMYGYYLLCSLIIVCIVFLLKNKIDDVESNQSQKESIPINNSQKLSWLVFSFVPSSLLLGVTTYLSTDIASVPLLWILPLVIYLLTFILAFAKKPLFSEGFFAKILPIIILPVAMSIVVIQTKMLLLTVILHLLTFFICAIVCHEQLAKKRPSTEHLTEYYLWISIGGFIGGLFNVLLAPLIFKTVLEYPIAILLACALRPAEKIYSNETKEKTFDLIFPLSALILVSIASQLLKKLNIDTVIVINSVLFGIPILIALFSLKRPLRFALCVATIMFASTLYSSSENKTIYIERSFFGVHKVCKDITGKYHYLVHGRTIHGSEKMKPVPQNEPLTYYYRTGPIGELLTDKTIISENARIAAIGLGAGSLAYYARQNQKWTFYEIDSVVEKIASKRKYFTFISECKVPLKIILGDGRLSIQKAPSHFYDLIILDAFSSDSIPVHIVTKQALEIYLQKLQANGILAFHISNQYIDLQPVLASLAKSLNLVCYIRSDLNVSKKETKLGKEGSVWVVMAQNKSSIEKLLKNETWKPLIDNKNFKVWTDDFSNILNVVKWQTK